MELERYKIKAKRNLTASVVRIDKSLNEYDKVVLFPQKVAKANKMLKEVGLPKLTVEKDR